MEDLLHWIIATPIVAALGGAALCGLIVALGAWVYPWLKWKRQGYPHEEEIEAILLPYILDAICLAYRLSERTADQVGERLHGVDKKRVADWLWKALPDEIVLDFGPFHYTLKPREIIDQESWGEMVQYAMNKLIGQYDYFVGEYEEEFLKWLLENTGGDGPVGPA